MVVEGDQYGTSISEPRYWSSELMVIRFEEGERLENKKLDRAKQVQSRPGRKVKGFQSLKYIFRIKINLEKSR